MQESGENTDSFGAYPGYVDLELVHPQKDYWRYNLPKLEEIKAKYDPRDVFHNPQSVRPAGAEVLGSEPVVNSPETSKKRGWREVLRSLCF
jgi:hypothetical protein